MSRRIVCGVTEEWSGSVSIDMKPRCRTRSRICCWREFWAMGGDSSGVAGFAKEHIRSIDNADGRRGSFANEECGGGHGKGALHPGDRPGNHEHAGDPV